MEVLDRSLLDPSIFLFLGMDGWSTLLNSLSQPFLSPRILVTHVFPSFQPPPAVPFPSQKDTSEEIERYMARPCPMPTLIEFSLPYVSHLVQRKIPTSSFFQQSDVKANMLLWLWISHLIPLAEGTPISISSNTGNKHTSDPVLQAALLKSPR